MPADHPYWPQGSEDAEQARWLAEAFEARIRYDHTAKRWHVWDEASGIWAPDQTQDVPRRVTAFALDRLMTLVGDTPIARGLDIRKRDALVKVYRRLFERNRTSSALEKLAELGAYKTNGADWDQDPNLLGCENGVVDLTRNVLIEPSPAAKVSLSTGHRFVPFEPDLKHDIWGQVEKRCPRFKAFLGEITETPGVPDSADWDLASFYLQWFGYSLFGHTNEQKFMILTGLGRNGKGALANTMRVVFGEYSARADQNIYMRSRMGSARSDTARADLMTLKGKRLAIMSEPDGGQFNEELLKAHTGGDPIRARALYSNNVIEWLPTHTITFLTNEPPKVNDIGPSMADRVLVGDFRRRFDGPDRDKKLYQRLEAEAEGILGVLCWFAFAYTKLPDGLIIPDRVQRASEEYMESNDPLGRALTEAFVCDPQAQSAARGLFDAYRDWFEGSDLEGEPLSLTSFGLALARKGFRKMRTSTGIVYRGIRPLTDLERAGVRL